MIVMAKDEKEAKKEAKKETKTSKTPRSPRKAKPERREGRKDDQRWGVANIFSTSNNTMIHITDITGAETISIYSGGMMTDRDREQGKPFLDFQSCTDSDPHPLLCQEPATAPPAQGTVIADVGPVKDPDFAILKGDDAMLLRLHARSGLA